MNASIRSRALRQAAKVAMGATFVGCASAVVPAGLPDVASVDAPTVDQPVVDATRDVSLVCNLTEQGDAGLSSQGEACCFALTTMAAPRDPASAQTVAATWSTDPSLAGCCHALYDTGGHRLVQFAYGANAQWSPTPCEICAVVVGDGAACSPWGPPVPPEMDANVGVAA